MKNKFKDLSQSLKDAREQTSEEEENNLTDNTDKELTPEPKSESFSSQQKKRRASGKRSNPDYDQIGVYLPKKIHLEAKKLLLDEPDTDFSDLIAKLLQSWIESKTSKIE